MRNNTETKNNNKQEPMEQTQRATLIKEVKNIATERRKKKKRERNKTEKNNNNKNP